MVESPELDAGDVASALASILARLDGIEARLSQIELAVLPIGTEPRDEPQAEGADVG